MPMSPRLLRPLATGFNPKSISGLVGWWDSLDSTTITTDTGVSAWADKSGNGYTLTQSTGANQPTLSTINGRQAFDYNGSTQFLESTAAGLVAHASGASRPPLTFFYVTHLDAAAQVWAVGFASTSSVAPLHHAIHPDGTSTWRHLFRNDASLSTTVSSTAAYATGAAYIVSSRTGADLVSNVNGSQVTNAANTTTGQITCNRFVVGALGRSTVGNFLNGRIGDVLIYNRTLTATETSTVERWLARRWGITLA